MNDITIKMNEGAMDELEKKAQLFLETVAENVRVEAQDIVPVDTGFLRDSIEVHEGADANEKLIGSTTTTYALFVELGHSSRAGNFVEAQPYMVPALWSIVKSGVS